MNRKKWVPPPNIKMPDDIVSAGIICFAFAPGTRDAYILLGKEREVCGWRQGSHKWGDFGGSRGVSESVVECAAREFTEETLGIVPVSPHERLPRMHSGLLATKLDHAQFCYKIEATVRDTTTDSVRKRVTYVQQIDWAPQLPEQFALLRTSLMLLDRHVRAYEHAKTKLEECLKQHQLVLAEQTPTQTYASAAATTPAEESKHTQHHHTQYLLPGDTVSASSAARAINVNIQTLFSSDGTWHTCVCVTAVSAAVCALNTCNIHATSSASDMNSSFTSTRALNPCVPADACYVSAVLAWQNLYDTLHRLPASLKWHRAIDTEYVNGIFPVGVHVNQDYLEKRELKWWSAPRLAEALDQNGFYRGEKFRSSFVRVGRLVLKRLMEHC